jgi:hypothetical protein
MVALAQTYSGASFSAPFPSLCEHEKPGQFSRQPGLTPPLSADLEIAPTLMVYNGRFFASMAIDREARYSEKGVGGLENYSRSTLTSHL